MKFYPAQTVCFSDSCNENREDGRRGVSISLNANDSKNEKKPRAPVLSATLTGIVAAEDGGVLVIFPPTSIRYVRFRDDVPLEKLLEEENAEAGTGLSKSLEELKSEVSRLQGAVVASKGGRR
jgi:hypothetical protein